MMIRLGWTRSTRFFLSVLAACVAPSLGCMSETPPPTFDDCPSVTVSGGDCYYRGYGTTCPVPCNFAPTCAFSVQVAWGGGGYCCSTENWYMNCRCEDGQSVCGTSYRSIPTSTCEFCNWDLGAPYSDLGVDGFDASADDASLGDAGDGDAAASPDGP